jgi:hypothetical protein
MIANPRNNRTNKPKTMKFKSVLSAVAYVGLTFGAAQSQAASITLFDYAYNVDGVVTAAPGPAPAGVNGAGFNFATGLGTITYSFNTAGSHFAGLFVDHEIDEGINTFFNEVGAAVGLPAAGWSWEIDEPGFSPPFGNIYANFAGSNATASRLDNTNGVPSGSANDVSMAMGWNFSLLAGESALVSFNLSTIAPTSGFYLQQYDPASNASVFFSGQGTITGTQPGVPDGLNTGAALGCLLLLGFSCRRWAVI